MKEVDRTLIDFFHKSKAVSSRAKRSGETLRFNHSEYKS